MATKKTHSIVLTFEREKETKGTQRYSEVGDKSDQVVGVLYIKKAGDSKLGSPEKIQVTIDPVSA
jgi:hypothetical protein